MTSVILQRVRIYISEQDIWDGRPLYLVVLEMLQREGATGATAMRGLGGFGPSQRVRTTGFVLSDNVPVVIEWVDRADRITNILPVLHEVIPNAFITLEDVHIYQGTLQAPGILAAEQKVGDIMYTRPQTLASTATLSQALRTMLAHNQRTLPILDEQQRILGVITEQEIEQRAHLNLPLRILRLLTNTELDNILSDLPERPVSEVMSSEPHSVYEGSAIPQALITMIEWNYEQVPVTSRAGTFVGLLDGDAVLSTVVEQHSDADPPQQTKPATCVRLVMQSVIPRVDKNQQLSEVLKFLLATASRYLVVIDEDGYIQGSLSDEVVLQHLTDAERTAWLTALQRYGQTTDAVGLPTIQRQVQDLMEQDVPTLAPGDSIVAAVQRVVELRADRVPVADESGKLLGLVARSGLLRALLQEGQ